MEMKEVAAKTEQGEPAREVKLPESEAEFTADPLEQAVPEEQKAETKDVPAQKQEQEKAQEEIDYKALYEQEKQKAKENNKRYITSSKEARKIKAKLKQLEAEKAKATTVQITDDELAQKYKDWNDLTSKEQSAIRRAENAERRAAAAEEAQKRYSQEDQFTQDLDDFLEIAEAEGAFPDVREQVDEFKRFARQAGNRGRDIEELAKIFTFDHPHQVQVPKTTLPFGNSGRTHERTEKKTMSWEQRKALRKNDPRKFEQMLEKGLLD